MPKADATNADDQRGSAHIRSSIASRYARASALLLVLALVAAIAPSSVSAGSADEAATEAYLQAVYTYEQALAANAPKSLAAVENLSAALRGECADVLLGAPPRTPSTPRGLGESAREARQLRELRTELISRLGAAFREPDREAGIALAAAVAPLQWSSAGLTARVHMGVAAELERLQPPIPNACADMRAWVSSGYQMLSIGTKAFQAAELAQHERIRADENGPPVDEQLAPIEGAAAKALIRRTEALANQAGGPAVVVLTSLQQLLRALGVHSTIAEAVEQSQPKPTVIGHGRTATGERFVATVGRPRLLEKNCKLSVSIENPRSTGSDLTGVTSASGGACLSNTYSGPEASVNCDAGRLTITASTPAAARTVSLLLSNGRVVTSGVIRAPRLGGRLGYYYQVVRGPSPAPVSLTVRDAAGRTLVVAVLRRIVECTKHPFKYLPGGRQVLVRGRVPQGPGFAIVAERYRFLGHVHFELNLRTASEPVGSSIEGGSSATEGSTANGIIGRPAAFALEGSTGCIPRPYDIVWGLLKAPGNTVLVREAGVLTRLPRVVIPAELHAGGALAYSVFSTPPTEVIVRDVHGRTIQRESLAESAKSTVERCEGETEPGS